MPLLLDTHAAIWYFSDSDQLSVTARNEIEAAVQRAEDVFLAAISLVEVIYLAEKGRLPAEALAKLEHALAEGKIQRYRGSTRFGSCCFGWKNISRCGARHAGPDHRRNCLATWRAFGDAGPPDSWGGNRYNLVERRGRESRGSSSPAD